MPRLNESCSLQAQIHICSSLFEINTSAHALFIQLKKKTGRKEIRFFQNIYQRSDLFVLVSCTILSVYHHRQKEQPSITQTDNNLLAISPFSKLNCFISPRLFVAVPSEEACTSLRGLANFCHQSEKSHILWTHVETSEELYLSRGDR